MADTKRKEVRKQAAKTHLACPYCEAEIEEAAFPFCKACGVKVLHCPVCHMTIERDSLKCLHCGIDLKEK